MQKTVHFIFIGLVLFVILFIGTNITKAQQLLVDHVPSVSFGDLLSGYRSNDTAYITLPETSMSLTTVTPIVSESESSRAEAANKIKEYLKGMSTMDDPTRNSLREFLVKSSTIDLSGNRQILKPSHIDTETKLSPDPSPYIPIPTLLAGVKEVLGIQTEPTNPVSSYDNLSSQINPSPTTHNSQLTTKSVYTIALLGDSMTNTLGNDLPHLRSFLSQSYPSLFFALLNYGFGATDLESGLYRLTNTTTYLGRPYPPLLSYKPDILVVESFAYNHWGGQKSDLDRQWLTIAKIIDAIRLNSPETKIILAATIAPNYLTYGDGVLNWPENLKWDAALITKAYLQNLVNFATSENYPLVDAYHLSLDGNANGRDIYINQSDHLHPSNEGAMLYSQQIVEAIKTNNLLN